MDTELWICNECGEIFAVTGDNYCPFCGSDDVEEYYGDDEDDE